MELKGLGFTPTEIQKMYASARETFPHLIQQQLTALLLAVHHATSELELSKIYAHYRDLCPANEKN